MAKRKKPVKRRGLGALPKEISRAAPRPSGDYIAEKAVVRRELKAIVPGDARQYDAAKKVFSQEIAAKHCPLALTALSNAAFSAGVARAAAVARGEDKGAEELYNDFLAQRDEYLAICHPDKKEK